MAETHKILVVDDEPVITESTKKILSLEGFIVRTTNAAETALDILRADKPDIILIDLKLPKLSGMELLEMAHKDFPGVAAIIMTGYSTLDNAVSSLKNGAFDFLPKPFTFEELLSTAHRASRFIKLAQTVPAVTNRPNCYLLGMHTWVKLDADGTALLGVTDLFQQIVGHIEEVKIPAVDDEIQQGSLLAQIIATDQVTHTAWAALSGRVIDSNRGVEENPRLLNRDPWESGWLVRIIPVNLENDLAHLNK
jgi:YesN/AraC family two-component response regulator